MIFFVTVDAGKQHSAKVERVVGSIIPLVGWLKILDKISASMSRYPVVSKIYFALALLGFVWSWFYFFQYFSSVGGVLIGPFLRAATANAVSSGVAIDACVTAIGFSVMVVTSATRDRVKWPWLYVVACFLVGVCVALPLYLGFRERTVMDNV